MDETRCKERGDQRDKKKGCVGFDISSVSGSLLHLLSRIFKYVCHTNNKIDHQWLSVIKKLPFLR